MQGASGGQAASGEAPPEMSAAPSTPRLPPPPPGPQKGFSRSTLTRGGQRGLGGAVPPVHSPVPPGPGRGRCESSGRATGHGPAAGSGRSTAGPGALGTGFPGTGGEPDPSFPAELSAPRRLSCSTRSSDIKYLAAAELLCPFVTSSRFPPSIIQSQPGGCLEPGAKSRAEAGPYLGSGRAAHLTLETPEEVRSASRATEVASVSPQQGEAVRRSPPTLGCLGKGGGGRVAPAALESAGRSDWISVAASVLPGWSSLPNSGFPRVVLRLVPGSSSSSSSWPSPGPTAPVLAPSAPGLLSPLPRPASLSLPWPSRLRAALRRWALCEMRYLLIA